MWRLDLAHLAIDEDLAAVGGVESIGNSHGRGFTCTILTNDGVNCSGFDDNVHRVARHNIAEAFCYLSEFEHAEV